jgi:hypothetical protein
MNPASFPPNHRANTTDKPVTVALLQLFITLPEGGLKLPCLRCAPTEVTWSLP